MMDAILGPGKLAMDAFVAFCENLSWLGTESHIVKLDAVDAQLMPVADNLGMDLPLIKYTVGLFLVYPFAALLRALPNKHMKHAFSMVGGLVLMQWCFGPDWIHSFLSSFGTYILCLVFPRKYLHIAVCVWVMTYMTASHGYRMYVSYMSGLFDFTGTQMVITMKLTSFAYNLYDGTADKKNVFGEHADAKKAKLYADRKRFAVTSLPNPLEFFGYVYCFTCILAGPAFEYNDYVRSIDGTAFKNPKSEGKQSAEPSSVVPGLVSLAKGVGSLVAHLVMSGYFPRASLYDPSFIASTGFFERYGFLMVCLLGERFKFYFAWKVAEGASVLGGFGFEGFTADGKVKGWRGVENIDMLQFETAPNVQTLSRAWNKRTQGWLERYTYQRTGRSLVATYFVSAIWHGLYPGFFFFFMSLPLFTNIERLVKAKLNPIFVPGYDGYKLDTYPKGLFGQIYWVVSWANTTVFLSYVVQTFSMGSYENCMTALGSYNFIPHVVLLVIYVLLEILPGGAKKKKA